MDHKKMKELANYAVSECMKHSKDGCWQISYEKLCQKFGIRLSDINQNKKLLEKELRQKEEIKELIMTEDCIEMPVICNTVSSAAAIHSMCSR